MFTLTPFSQINLIYESKNKSREVNQPSADQLNSNRSFNFGKGLKNWKIILSILLVTLIDQISKTFLISYLKTKPGYLIEVLPFLDIVYAWNYGISFGLFRQYYQYSNYVLLGVNTVIIIWLYYTLQTTANILSKIGLIFIIGGALGNIIDRCIRGAVFDFILVHYHEYEFPIFNLADSAITVGAVIFAYDYFFSKKSLEE